MRPLLRSTAIDGSIASVNDEPALACSAVSQCRPPSSDEEKKMPLLTAVQRLPPVPLA